MPLALSPATLLPFLGLILPIYFVTRSVLRNRGSNGGSGTGGSGGGGGGRHSGGVQPESQVAAEPDWRSAPPPDPQLAYQPDPRFGGNDTAFAPVAVAATSVLASNVDSDAARPTLPPSDNDAAFPTAGRALSLVGGHTLAALSILVLLLTSTPTGHHESHANNSSVGFFAIVCMFVGFSFAVVATSRVQRDVMGGGWNSWYSFRYISPQIAWWVISPSGISAAARRLNVSAALVILIEYGLLAADVFIIFARYVGR